MIYKIKRDRFRKVRDGFSTIYLVSCSGCGSPLLVYQKDGRPHQWLKRLYGDRILETKNAGMAKEKTLFCKICGINFANFMIYKKESRPAFNLIKGTIKKKIIQKG